MQDVYDNGAKLESYFSGDIELVSIYIETRSGNRKCEPLRRKNVNMATRNTTLSRFF